MDPTEQFLREVARLLPDADVVNVRHPPPPDDAPPADVAASEAEQLWTRAVDELVHVWQRVFPSLPSPDVVRVRWIAERYPQTLRAEASTRLPGESAPAAAELHDPYDVGQDGWAATRKVRTDGRVQIRARRGDMRLDIGAAPSEDVVVARVVSEELVVGDYGKRLLAAGLSTVPWPVS